MLYFIVKLLKINELYKFSKNYFVALNVKYQNVIYIINRVISAVFLGT